MTPAAIPAHAQEVYTAPSSFPQQTYLVKPSEMESVDLQRDEWYYQQGKTLRDTQRGKQAKTDARYSVDALCARFSESFGMEVSAERTPATYALMASAYVSIGTPGDRLKYRYHRIRPCVYYDEPTGSGEVFTNYSYPSVHAMLGWFFALLLAEINPAAQDAVLQRGYDYGQSRVIVGAHWQSDVDAGRLVASTYFARLHAEQAFLEDVQAARTEVASLIATAAVAPAADKAAGEQLFTVDGRKAAATSRGIVVGKGVKRVAR